MTEPSSSERATNLRRAFDDAFAAPARAIAPESVRLLVLRIAEQRYALPLGEIGGLVPVRKIVPLPTVAPEILGLAGHRGALVTVFDLALVLGHAAPTTPRWIAMCGRTDPIGLAFDALEDQITVPATDVHAITPGASDDRTHVRALVAVAGNPVAIIAVRSILDAVSNEGR